MTVINGIEGSVSFTGDVVSTVRKWTVEYKESLVNLVASNTDSAQMVLAGNKDWSATVSAYLTPDFYGNIIPGNSITFTGSTNDAVGVTGTGIIEEITIKWDIEGAKPIEVEIKISGNSALTRGAAVISGGDTTCPEVRHSIGCKLELASDHVTYTEVADIRTMTFTLTRPTVSYVSSSTGAIVKRLTGNLGGKFDYTLYPGQPSTLPATGTTWSAKAYIDADEYLDLQFLRVAGVSGIECDIETAAVLGATVNTEWTGWLNVGGTDGCPTQGQIILGGSILWD